MKKAHDLKVKPSKPEKVSSFEHGYYPSLSLTDKQFPPLKGKKVGDVCHFTVTGQVTSMSQGKHSDGCSYSLDLRKAVPAGKSTVGKPSAKGEKEPDPKDKIESSESDEEGY